MGRKEDKRVQKLLGRLNYIGHIDSNRKSGSIIFSRNLMDLIDFGPRRERETSFADVLPRLHPEDADWVRFCRTREIGPSRTGEYLFRAFDRRGKTRWLQQRFGPRRRLIALASRMSLA